MKIRYFALLSIALTLSIPMYAQTAPDISGYRQSGTNVDLEVVLMRLMPFATVMTATFTFCIMLFMAGAVRKLHDIHNELKKSNEASLRRQ